MPFWSAAQVADPKRSFRWVVEMGFDGLSNHIAYICSKVSKPKMQIAEGEHKFLNHTFYYPGSVSYEKVSLTMVDPANPHSTELLYNLLQDAGYQLPSGIQDDVGANSTSASTISKRLATRTLGRVVIVMLDGEGNRIEDTVLNNAWISSVDFGGDLDYESENLMPITIELRYDWFTLKTYPQSGGITT